MSRRKEILAAIVAQRLEMGDTAWYISPELAEPELFESAAQVNAGSAATKKNAGRAVQSEQAVSRESGSMPNEPATPQPGADFPLSDITGSKTLATLEDTVCGCMRCELGATRTKFVFGDGNPQADIMFIGEAPGADEDREGKPFVGRAGKLLTDMIIAMKLTREDVFIGNILKCRPPGNRDPKPAEIAACEPILLRQIELIQPKIICALGRVAGQTLLRSKSSLGGLRGTIHDYHDVKLIVTYHPAALLRNPHWKRPTWDDLKMLRREYDGLEL